LRNELRHTLELGVGTGLSSLFRIAFVVIAGRVLGPAEYADFYAALSIGFLFAAATAPIAGTITRFVSLYSAKSQTARIAELRRHMPRRLVRWSLGLAVLGLLAVGPVSQWLHFESVVTPLLLAAIVPLNLLIDTPRGFLRGLQKFRSYGASLAIESALRLALCLIAFRFVRSAPAALSAQALATLIVLGVTLYLLRRASPETNIATESEIDVRELERFTLPLFGFAIVAALFQNVDSLVVKALFDAVPAGQFGAVNALSKLIWLVFLPFGILSLPLLTAEFSAGRSVWPPLARTVAGFLIASGVVLIAFRLFGGQLLELLYGAEYAPAAPVLIPLTVGVVLSATAILIGQAFTAMNRFQFLAVYTAGFLLQITWMYFARESTLEIAHAIVSSQLIVIAGMLGLLFVASRNPALAKSPSEEAR